MTLRCNHSECSTHFESMPLKLLCFQQEEYTDHETNAGIAVVPFAFIFSDTFGEFVLPNLMTLD